MVSEDKSSLTPQTETVDEPREAPLPSPAYSAFTRGDYAVAASLINTSDTDGDPIDLTRALALDPALPITAIVLAIVWTSLVFTVL